MNTSEAIAALDAIDPGYPESAHEEADKVLLAYVHPSIKDAYDRLVERTGCWWYA